MSTNTSGSLTNEQKAVYYDTVAAELARVKGERDRFELLWNSLKTAKLRDYAELRARVTELERETHI